MLDLLDAFISFFANFFGGAKDAEELLTMIRVVVAAAPIVYLLGLYRFRNLLSERDASSVSKLIVAAYFLFAGVVIEFLPFGPDLLASICRLVAQILMLVGFGRLRRSESFPAKARRGAVMAFVATWLVVAGWLVGWIPMLGDILDFVLRLLALIFVLIGWGRIKGALDGGDGTMSAEGSSEGRATAVSRSEMRGYDDERLAEIVASPSMYRAELVEACLREQELRRKGAELMPSSRSTPTRVCARC